MFLYFLHLNYGYNIKILKNDKDNTYNLYRFGMLYKKRVAQTIVWSWNRNDFRCIVYTFISNLLVQKMPHNDNGTTCQPTFDTNTWLCINSTKQWLINKWFTINTFKWFIFLNICIFLHSCANCYNSIHHHI